MSIDLAALSDAVTPPDEDARDEARARQLTLTKPAGALGRLEDLATWLAGTQGRCPPTPLDKVTVVVFAGDHGVARRGVSAYPPDVTAQMVLNILDGGAAVSVLARLTDARIRVLDIAVDVEWAELGVDVPAALTAHKVRRSSDDLAVGPALTHDEAAEAFMAGQAVADEEVDSGCDLLVPGDMGIGNTTPAAALTAVLTGLDVASAVGRGTGIDDATWMVKCAAVRDCARRGRAETGDMIGLLATCGGADLAAMTGFLVQAAVRRTPVLLDGVVSHAAALVAQRVAHRARHWWVSAHRSTEPAQHAAIERLRLSPVMDLQMRLGEGTGALVVLPVLRAAQATLADMATFDQAGVHGPEPS